MRRLGFLILLATLLSAGGAFSATAGASPKSDSEYRYRDGGYRITVTYTCDDGTVVPGPHPLAIIEAHGRLGKWKASISAHGVEKLDVAMQTYFALSLRGDAKAFEYAMLPQVSC